MTSSPLAADCGYQAADCDDVWRPTLRRYLTALSYFGTALYPVNVDSGSRRSITLVRLHTLHGQLKTSFKWYKLCYLLRLTSHFKSYQKDFYGHHAEAVDI